MTRQEFIQSKKRQERGVLLPAFLSLGVMVVLPFVWEFYQMAHQDLPTVVKVAGHIICVGVLVFTVWFVYVHLARKERRHPFCCPNCHKGFAATETGVLLSGRCYYCGFQVIDDAA